ncbi:MAG: CoA pyrophosphatase [Chlorobi bacterium]|nr:CoA pyrophosphatase [Chlorobiota bacterium]
MNDFAEFTKKLKTSLTSLPGLEAQLRMAPVMRLQELKMQAINADTRQSAVLILFYPHKGKIMCVLMRRPSDNSVHSGQVSFPGGKFEETDIDLRSTALREANEEMGIVGDDVEIIGKLSPLFIPPSNFDVYPFVGITQKRPEFMINKDEVEQLIEVEFGLLLDPGTFTHKNIKHRNGKLVDVPCFHFDVHIVWGATAMIISELIWVFKNHKA